MDLQGLLCASWSCLALLTGVRRGGSDGVHAIHPVSCYACELNVVCSDLGLTLPKMQGQVYSRRPGLGTALSYLLCSDVISALS